MDAFAIQNQIFSSQVEESNRIFQDDSAFEAKYAAMKADIARARAEIEADKERLGF